MVFLGRLCSLQPYSSPRKRIGMKILQVLITFLLTTVSLFFLTYRKMECVLYRQTHFIVQMMDLYRFFPFWEVSTGWCHSTTRKHYFLVFKTVLLDKFLCLYFSFLVKDISLVMR